MTAIKAEADRIAAGKWPTSDNPLVNAPHTVLARDHRVPDAYADPHQYWPPVRRIDQAHGDRNLVCACPPIEAFA